jgi:amidohydrolase
VAQELNSLGLEVSTGVAETGVVAMIEGARPGPVALLRFDMDALPIHEETGAEYASQNPGVMHACGHDGHTAVGLTAARLLHAHRDELNGSVKLVFQPAEVGLGGARRMIHEGVLADPRRTVSRCTCGTTSRWTGGVPAGDGGGRDDQDRGYGQGGTAALHRQSTRYWRRRRSWWFAEHRGATAPLKTRWRSAPSAARAFNVIRL